MNSWGIKNQIRKKVAEEEGILRKIAPLNVALCYPAPYEVAMSSLGFQAIYQEIHRHPDASAERAFLPDNPEEYRRNRVPIFTYENERPLSDFSVVAFSIAYELEITGIFEMLDLCGIPLLRGERAARHPFILAGGPQTVSNPAILFPFVDGVILGEGEERIHQFLDIAAGTERKNWPDRLALLPGCYVPGVSAEIPAPCRAPDGSLPASSRILTKNTVLSSMFLIEPERGCSRLCAYCVMRGRHGGGMRTVPAGEVLRRIPENARRVGLVGAAVTDHPQIRDLVGGIVESGREIGVSSLRADRLADHLGEEFVGLLAKGGYRTLTTASDGASRRMRDMVGRNTRERHLVRAAELARLAGMSRLKLYEMIGFPGETMDDIEELIRFSLEISRITPLSLSVSPFVAKRNTPLGGAPFEDISILESKISRIRAGLKGAVEVKPGSSRFAWIEYMLSQGNDSAGLAAMYAWRHGGRFAAWKRAFILNF
ncbi:MAG: B12-binding domain-containing radical SAM protein [Acidobacteria bacterium]|nr:B12-binding domain-containing radical SAM protein [Acidobacteriota bacterium]